MPVLPILEYLQKQIAGELRDGDSTYMRYPTAISQTLNMRIVAVWEISSAKTPPSVRRFSTALLPPMRWIIRAAPHIIESQQSYPAPDPHIL